MFLKSKILSDKFIQGAIIVAISVLVIFTIVKAAPPDSPYSPGATLAPICTPGSTNCTVVAPAISTRNINTTLPLSGGGDLSADRTFSIGGLSSLGTANYLLGANSGATGWEYKQLLGTTDQLTVTHGVGSVTLSLPQDIAVTSSPTFNGLALTGNLTASSTVTTANFITASSSSLTSGDFFKGVVNATNLTGNLFNFITDATSPTTLFKVSNLGALTAASINGNTITSGTGTLTLSTYTLTVAGTASVSGTNTGDETQATIKTKLGAATTSVDGYLTSTDWNTFNNKAPALGVDDNYVTDAQLVVIGNTSGTNTGDNATNSSTMYIGTTAVALNRASAALALTGVTSIDGSSASTTGNAATVTNATLTTALTVNTGTVTLTGNIANTSVLTIGAGAVSVSGSNTGDQTITLTGDVTGSGTGSFAATIANDAVTYAKMQNVSAADRLLGRSTAESGDIEEITVGGDISQSGSTFTIGAGAVSLSKMANLAANSIIGNNTGSAATPLALSASDTKTLLSLNSVENTALSTWVGSTNLTTAGALNATSLTLAGNLAASSTVTTSNFITASSSSLTSGDFFKGVVNSANLTGNLFNFITDAGSPTTLFKVSNAGALTALSATLGTSGDTILTPDVADGASAIAYTFDTINTLSTTAKIASFKNNGTVVAGIGLGAQANPAIFFGDGDTGFYETADDNLALSFAGTKYWDLTATKIASSNSTQPALLRTTPTATVPSINANNGDADTGIGSAGADIMSLIAGGIEIAQFTEATSYYSTFNGLLNAATGDETAFTLNYTTNKLTSGDDYGLKIVQTDTASPGTSYLLWAGVGATSKFSVTNAGLVTVAGNLRVAGGLISSNAAGQALTVMDSNIGTSSATMLTLTTGTWTTGTGNAAISVKIAPTYNQTGTASATDFLINRTQTAVGSGAQYLIDAQVGGASKFSVGNTGFINASSTVTTSNFITASSSSLTSGDFFKGVVNSANLTGNLFNFITDAGSPTTLFKVDNLGAITQDSAKSCATGLTADADGKIICTISSLKYKENVKDLNFDKERFFSLQTRSFDWKKDVPFSPAESGSIGFIAEEVNQSFPELIRLKNGEPEGVKYELLSVYLFDTAKDLFVNFTKKIQASLAEFGIQLENGIIYLKEVIADKFTTKQLCLAGDDGETICIDKNQLKQLMQQNGAPIFLPTPTPAQSEILISTPIPSPTLSPTSSLSPAPTTTIVSESSESLAPTPTLMPSESFLPSEAVNLTPTPLASPEEATPTPAFEPTLFPAEVPTESATLTPVSAESPMPSSEL